MKIQHKETHEKFKILLISFLVISGCISTYYLHVYLNIEIIFTHLYYVPIILASLWWRKRGLIIALIFGAFLIACHYFAKSDVTVLDDLIRVGMFVFIAVIIDMLSEKIDKTSKILKENEENFRTLVENANEGILIAMGQDGHFTFANQTMAEITGYSIQEIVSSNIRKLAAAGEQEKLLECYQKRMRGEDVPKQYESIFKRKSGKNIHVEITGATTYWRGQPADLIIVRDITDRKRAEKKLKENQRKLRASERNLKRFSQKILTIREEEKKKISINLHDEIGAMAVALNSNLSLAEEEIDEKNCEMALESIHQTRDFLKKSIQNLKKIIIDLMPTNLELVGLSNALKEYLSDIRKKTDLEIIFNASLDSQRLNDKITIALYRIVQESLNNIINHAKAENVRIDLFPLKNNIQLIISDDGKGFDVDKILKQQGKQFKIGIHGMKERVESLGGTFKIKSEPKKGSTIEVMVPFMGLKS